MDKWECERNEMKQRRTIESGDGTSELGLDVQDRLERRPEMFDLGNHVTLIHVVLLDVFYGKCAYKIFSNHDGGESSCFTHWLDHHLRELLDQGRHGGDVVVHSAKQDGLVPDREPCLA